MTPAPTPEAAIRAALVASSTLTTLLSGTAVYRQEIPPNVSLPAVVFSKASGNPAYTLAGRVWEATTYQVKGVTEGMSGLLAGSIDAAIDAALSDTALAYTSGTALYCRRLQAIDYPEVTPGGQRFQHRGGLYSVWIA